MEQDLIIFEGYNIQKLTLEKNYNISKEKKQTIDFNIDVSENLEKKYKDKYRVTMKLMVYTEISEIYVEFSGFFKISNKLEEENKIYFLNVSAPAIIYPYIRALVSNITAVDTGDTVILPVIDFVSIARMNNNDK